MSLSAQNLCHPAATVINHSSHPPSSTPNPLSSAPPNSTHPTSPSKHAANDSTTSNPQLLPFFTLIEDVHTTHHHHPTVHYIFSDDSTDLITEAALRTLDNPLSTAPHHQHPHTDNEIIDDDPTPTALPPPRPGVSHRYVLLDLFPSPPGGDAVIAARAHSLTPDWQVLNVEIAPAPTWDAEPEAQGAGGAERRRPLMLRIEGTEGVRGGLEGGDGDVGEGGEVEMEELVGVFEKRMVELRRLVEVEGGAGVGGGAG